MGLMAEREELNEIKDSPVKQTYSFGERRVGAYFNPSGLKEIDNIKSRVASLIDEIERKTVNSTDPEIHRWKSIALTKLEEGCMFAVKTLANQQMEDKSAALDGLRQGDPAKRGERK